MFFLGIDLDPPRATIKYKIRIKKMESTNVAGLSDQHGFGVPQHFFSKTAFACAGDSSLLDDIAQFIAKTTTSFQLAITRLFRS
jgi:hypothetical protein